MPNPVSLFRSLLPWLSLLAAGAALAAPAEKNQAHSLPTKLQYTSARSEEHTSELQSH